MCYYLPVLLCQRTSPAEQHHHLLLFPIHIATPFMLYFYSDATPVTKSTLVNVFSKSGGGRKELVLVSNTDPYKGWPEKTFIPKAWEDGEGGKPPFIQSKCLEILWKQEMDIHRHPICTASTAELLLLPRYVAEGRYQGTTMYCHANDAVTGGTSQQQSAFLSTSLILALKKKQNNGMKGRHHLSKPEPLPQSCACPKTALGAFKGPYCSLFKQEQGVGPCNPRGYMQCFITTLFSTSCEWHRKQWKTGIHNPSLRKPLYIFHP